VDFCGLNLVRQKEKEDKNENKYGVSKSRRKKKEEKNGAK